MTLTQSQVIYRSISLLFLGGLGYLIYYLYEKDRSTNIPGSLSPNKSDTGTQTLADETPASKLWILFTGLGVLAFIGIVFSVMRIKQNSRDKKEVVPHENIYDEIIKALKHNKLTYDKNNEKHIMYDKYKKMINDNIPKGKVFVKKDIKLIAKRINKQMNYLTFVGPDKEAVNLGLAKPNEIFPLYDYIGPMIKEWITETERKEIKEKKR